MYMKNIYIHLLTILLITSISYAGQKPNFAECKQAIESKPSHKQRVAEYDRIIADTAITKTVRNSLIRWFNKKYIQPVQIVLNNMQTTKPIIQTIHYSQPTPQNTEDDDQDLALALELSRQEADEQEQRQVQALLERQRAEEVDIFGESKQKLKDAQEQRRQERIRINQAQRMEEEREQQLANEMRREQEKEQQLALLRHQSRQVPAKMHFQESIMPIQTPVQRIEEPMAVEIEPIQNVDDLEIISDNKPFFYSTFYMKKRVEKVRESKNDNDLLELTNDLCLQKERQNLHTREYLKQVKDIVRMCDNEKLTINFEKLITKWRKTLKSRPLLMYLLDLSNDRLVGLIMQENDEDAWKSIKTFKRYDDQNDTEIKQEVTRLTKEINVIINSQDITEDERAISDVLDVIHNKRVLEKLLTIYYNNRPIKRKIKRRIESINSMLHRSASLDKSQSTCIAQRIQKTGYLAKGPESNKRRSRRA